MKDEMGDRLKSYEVSETDRYLDDNLPVIVRIDGRAFSTFTKDFVKPFDEGLTRVMQNVTKQLIKKTGAIVGYTQSDEITLVLEKGIKENSQIFFNGKVQKLTSITASLTTALFIREFCTSAVIDKLPHFDSRVFNVPSRDEAINVLLWRMKDAHRNAISSVCQSKFSQKQLNGLSKSNQIELLKSIGIDFDQHFESMFKVGSFYVNYPCLVVNEATQEVKSKKEIIRIDMPCVPTFQELKGIYNDVFSS